MTKTWRLFRGGLGGAGLLNVLESFFRLLDVMRQLSREILLDEAVKEGRNHKRGSANEWNSSPVSLTGLSGREDHEWSGVRPSRHWLPNNGPCL